MTKRKYNRKAVKGAMVTEYLDKHGYVTPEVLAAEVGVSESYAAKWLRKWKLAKKNWETRSVVRSKDYIPKPQVHETPLLDNEIEYVDGRPTKKIGLNAEVLAEQQTSSLGTKLADNAQQAPIMQPLAGRSDGSTASYYELPAGAKELQDLISYKNMNAQIGEIFRACMRYGESSHSDELRDAKKIKFYIDAEIRRLGG